MQNFVAYFKFRTVESLTTHISVGFFFFFFKYYRHMRFQKKNLFAIKAPEIVLFTNKTITIFY